MSSPADSGHLPAPVPPPNHPLPPSAPPASPSPSPATHGASPPKPKSTIPTTAPPPPPPPEPNASVAFSRSSPAATTSAGAEDHQSPPSGAASITSAGAEDHQSPPSTSAAIASSDCTPRMDMEFETELQGYDLYRLYAFKLGFNVRRRYTNRSKTTGDVTSCKFACSREGFKDHKPTGATAKLPRAAARLSRAAAAAAAAAAVPAPDGRTGCNAHLTIRRSKPGGSFQVSGFQPRHNHPLVAAQRSPHSPFHSPPNAAANVVPPSDATTAGAACAEGEGPLRTRRHWEIKYGEAAALLNYLERQSLADPAFHHAVQLDVEDKVANVLWVDAKMVADYAHFGDAVAFHVVSRNSISLRHLASFVGCNSFGEPVVFALALMYDETCESFRWLFQTFLRAMSGRAPKTLISHQDTVIAEALSLAMPGTTTTHAICTWRIKHAAKGNIRQLSKGDASFIEEFEACVDGEYDEEAEFLAAWDAMITKYELCDNAWFQSLFEEKHKWARPYAKAIFSAGMEGTRLNERLSSEVRVHLRAEVDIVLFLRHLQKVVSDRRHRELEMEYGSRLMMPYLKIRAPVLTQASEVYTSVIFQLFQEEYEEFQSAYIVSRDESGPCREYVVSLVEKEDRRYMVYGNPTEQTVSCSCGKFETVGFLCSHALKILDVMDIKYIPERYIMKRWTKYARRLTSPPEVLGQAVQAEESSEISSRYQHLCPKYVRLVARASECEESSRVLDQFWGELGEKVEQILQKQTSVSAPVTQPDVQNLKMALSSITSVTESENLLEKSSSAAAITVKKKGQKSKNHPRNCSEKGPTKKQRVHSEEPAVVQQYGFIDGPAAQSGHAMYQGLGAPPNMSEMGSQTPAYKAYMGTDFSNPMGTINYEGMHPGASLGFTLLPSQDLGFVPYACHTSQASNDSQHSQTL